MIERERAWRLFAEEFNSSTLEIKGMEERKPSYIITPLGARANRVFVVGVITDVENVGEEMWRARLSDPTGVFYLVAGKFQPEMSATLAGITPPKFFAVVGKVRTYKPDEGKMYVSIRPELAKEVSANIRDNWVIDTCKSMLKRINALEEAKNSTAPEETLLALGYKKEDVDAFIKAIEHYGTDEIEKYKEVARDALRFLITSENESSDNAKEEEEMLQIIANLETKTRGARWDKIIEACRKKGMQKEKAEEILNLLTDKGLIYEPVLGEIRRI
ncbi:MAG: hypothetical protein AB1779_03050 [Candidatus Thermoplasmatota archaeon]